MNIPTQRHSVHRVFFLSVAICLCVFFILACSPSNRHQADDLNDTSYFFHYRNLDSTEHYARQALMLSEGYPDGKAEALNNLAFANIGRMNYQDAIMLLDSVPTITDNQIELLVSYIQQMRLCQRMSRNRAFYDFREQADASLRRLLAEEYRLSPRQKARLLYAKTEMAIVVSTYFYYVGLDEQSSEALLAVKDEVRGDTAQWLNYLYNVGAGGIIRTGNSISDALQEMECLMLCYLMATDGGYDYFTANSLESIAEHMSVPEHRNLLLEYNHPAINLLNSEDLPYGRLPMWLAERSLQIFVEYGDVYQTAGAFRTLASCAHNDGDDASAIYYLQQSITDSLVMQAPDLVASIREQLSIAYAGINDKARSDQNRNVYLDLQEQTRQDRSLEARATQLDHTYAKLRRLLLFSAILLGIFLILVVAFIAWRRKVKQKSGDDAEVQRRREELAEEMSISRLHIEKGRQQALEQRAKMSLVDGIMPFIDRLLHEVKSLETHPDDKINDEHRQYIIELADEIDRQNEMLTKWIQLRQGELQIRIESFALQPLFDIVVHGRTAFQMKGVTLNALPTDAVVKADRVLTLFMINTLSDNARKFTEQGGEVTISAEKTDDYVEISVADTGCGISDEELPHIFDHKISGGHGFGLQNCKGIIEKYRKVSKLFSVCQLSAESTLGKGSRFFFRLPLGTIRNLCIALSFFFSGMTMSAEQVAGTPETLLRAKAFADSAYFSNIDGTYQITISYADSCLKWLNRHHQDVYASNTDTLTLYDDISVPCELQWLHRSVTTDYDVILDVRNETAVAALALHDWQLYHYNNKAYIQLFKELSADKSLEEYCRRMQQSQANTTTAIIVIAILILFIIVAICIQIVHMRNNSESKRQSAQRKLDLRADELRRLQHEEASLHVINSVVDNCLSALKHETMYYPARIRHLVAAGDDGSLGEVVSYYRELYSILSSQARQQTSRAKLHLKHLEHNILGDEVLVKQLFAILRHQANVEKLEAEYITRDDGYVECRVPMPTLSLTEEQAANYFSVSSGNINNLLCRQIVRDHGEATNRRACAIRAEVKDHKTIITVILPSCKTSKS